MAKQANPNPQRISAPLWSLVQRCTDLTGTSFSAEYGGTWLRKPGSHADTAWLKANYPNDYSLKGSKQNITTGPLSAYGRAFDWTFPSAQAGDWSEIGVYSNRVKNAWNSNDPRMYGVFEILCQTPEDKQPEGYVWYPEKKFRVPDSSHEWHMHIGILTQYINDQAAMDALFSVLVGASSIQEVDDLDFNQNAKLDGVFNLYDEVELDTGASKQKFPVPITERFVAMEAVLAEVQGALAELLARPPVESAPIDSASLVTALQDPAVQEILIEINNMAEDA
jgi:hypothetical protein